MYKSYERGITEMNSSGNRKELEKSVARTYGSLAVALLATALLVYNVSDGAEWIPLVIVGGLSALFSALISRRALRWKREQIVRHASSLHMENVIWFLGISTLGIGALQLGFVWGRVVGFVLIGVAYFILGSGIGLNMRSIRKQRAPTPPTAPKQN